MKYRLSPDPQPPYYQLSHPVVLIHGWGMIGSLFRTGMFHHLALELRKQGIVAFAPNVVPYHSIETRAQEWKLRINRILEQTNAEKVHLIAHSMGGLDMRYFISELDGWQVTQSLTTVSTPHHGAVMAQFTLDRPELLQKFVYQAFKVLGDSAFPHTPSDPKVSIRQLTKRYINEEFNPNILDHPAVIYQSCAGVSGKGTSDRVHPSLKLQNLLIYQHEGVNDGMISVESAKWSGFMGTFNADHARQVGIGFFPTKFDYLQFYLDLCLEVDALSTKVQTI